MAVFRIDKTRDYTVMSNHHLRNKSLSLKAKGLLSLMLSLPDNWDYTTKGLACICKDGIDSISSAIKELESAGYVIRRRLRNAQGRLTEIEYIIMEQPQVPVVSDDSPTPEKPKRENPILDNPRQVIPRKGNPVQENPAQLNTNIKSNKKESNTHSFFPSEEMKPARRKNDGQTEREKIRAQIEYDFICERYNRSQLDELVEIMVDVSMNRSGTIKIGRDAEYPTDFVQERFRKITSVHIEKVMEGLKENTTRVLNTKAYLMAALFNAATTIDNHYAMMVNHDLYGNL